MIFKLANQAVRLAVCRYVMDAPEGWVVRITEPTRSLEQNAFLWPLLTDLSEQVDWYGKKLTPEDWKDVCTAALKKTKVVPAMDGQGFVSCGMSTRKMGKAEFSELIDLIQAFGAEHDVKWSEHVG